MLPLGTIAPNFNLLDTHSDDFKSLEQLKGEKGTVIFFICNHCPFVLHVNAELVKLANHYNDQGISFIGISSNDVLNYPQDGPVQMKAQAKSEAYPFPYLYDETQDIAQAYAAACTPDTYVFDSALKLIYRGQLDGSRPGNGIPVTGEDLRHALNCVLDEQVNNREQKPSIGCNIKWK